ncbi:T9SS C-terminal target domain-containing protein [Mucilaginibacter terrenus]|uniref:T9SS C-terminal target domain-containing protein n=1 Tax=Mucilaginibacter terrenus TaxID=2482727 RepID=A0A3E2NY39_9SPHI|nr:T9SS type A sorting domain-containing protein [Mucilaginibacter terrenus]RFZ85934.1 T9SS C-terminal target domain-containing protein [Mucilaginibacter terrenus]
MAAVSVLLVATGVHAQVLLSDDFETSLTNTPASTTNPVWSGSLTEFAISSSPTISPLAGSSSLASYTHNSEDNIYTTYNAGTSNVNMVWRLLYKNTGSTTDSADPNNGKRSWNFWLAANGSNPTTCYGYYLTERQGVLYLRRYNGGTTNLASFTLTNNTTYSIKVTRRGSDGLWVLYVDAGTGEATTSRGSTNNQEVATTGTLYTILLSNDKNEPNTFLFDNYSISQASATLGCTTAGLASSSYLFSGDVNKAVHSFQLTYIEDLPIKQLTIYSSGALNNGQISSFSLVKSTNTTYGDGDDVTLTATDFTGNNNGSNFRFDNNNTNGYLLSGTSSATTVYFFLVLNLSSTFVNTSMTSTFSMSSANSSLVFSANNSINMAAYSCTGNTYSFGKLFDWYGNADLISGSPDLRWSSNKNWVLNGNTGSIPGAAPTQYDKVRIASINYVNSSRQPLVDASTTIAGLEYGSLSTSPTFTLNSGITVTVNGDVSNGNTAAALAGSGTLAIGGNFTNSSSATFTTNRTSASSQNTISFTSSSAQTITNSNTSTTPSVVLGNLTFSGGGTKTFAAGGYYSVSPYSTVTLSGSTIVSIPSSTTHLQLLTGTTTPFLTYAQIATIPTGSSIQGNIDYQVYFQGGSLFYRNYRAMAAPVYSGSYSASNGSYSLASLKNTFIITGLNGSANGFDKSTNNGATLRTYNPATNNYTFITSLNTLPTVASGQGFYMYYRGNNIAKPNATVNDPYGAKTNSTLGAGGNTYATPEAVTYTYTGVPNQGDVSAATLPNGSNYFYFIANPYAATLDANAVIAASNISLFTWTWDPVSGTYAVYDSSTPAASTHGAKRYIVPGQGFFVKNSNTSGSSKTLKITEAMKSTGNSASAVRLLSTGAPSVAAEPPVIRLQFYKNASVRDELGIVLSSVAKDSLDAGDAAHLNGDYLNLTSITPDNQYLTIDKRPFKGTRIIVPLFINVAADSIYTFKKTYLSPVMSNYKVTLYDSLLNNKVEITNIDYSFNVYRAKPETFGGKRFKLIIEQLPAPVTFFEFKGKLNGDKKGLLTWQTNRYRLGTTYQVQRAPDTTNFTDIGLAQVGVDTTGKGSYQLVDSTIQQGNNYYRLVQTDVFGNKSYSNKVMINLSSAVGPVDVKNGFKLYPNPVVTGFSILSDKSYTGKVSFRIYNSNSEIKISGSFTQLNAFESVKQDVSQLKLGVYFIELRDANNKVLTTLKFIKQ